MGPMYVKKQAGSMLNIDNVADLRVSWTPDNKVPLDDELSGVMGAEYPTADKESFLLSIGTLVKEGYEFYLGKQDGGSYMIPANSLEKVPVKLTPDNAFVVQVALKKHGQVSLRAQNEQNVKIHRICGHLGSRILSETKRRGMVKNFEYFPSCKLQSCNCQICVANKQGNEGPSSKRI